MSFAATLSPVCIAEQFRSWYYARSGHFVQRDMRIVVVGTSGAGKSTFSESLARATACPYIELDALHWGPNWEPVPAAMFASAVRAATEADRWVVDGNYSAVRDVLWARATHIIWMNFSRTTVFSRVLIRTVRRIVWRTTLSHGNRESFRAAFMSKDSIVLWSLTTFARNRRKFAALRQDSQFAHLHWTELTQPSQTEECIAGFAREAVAHCSRPLICGPYSRDTTAS
jgi:adenylate kinase family enzyme